jgi:hypothetical protein
MGSRQPHRRPGLQTHATKSTVLSSKTYFLISPHALYDESTFQKTSQSAVFRAMIEDSKPSCLTTEILSARYEQLHPLVATKGLNDEE